jgi:uncharacterized OB-fold protein
MSAERPRPNIDEDIAPFWAAVAERRFVLLRCTTCGAWYWPASYCRNHGNEPFMANLEWQDASGRGTVFAFTIHRRAFHPAFAAEVPYVYALIALDEGPMFGSNIVDCAPEDVRTGMPVEVTFVERAESGMLPLFRPRT